MSKYKEYGWNRETPLSCRYLYRGIAELLSNDNKCILDVGCGNGKLSNQLLKEGYDIYGIDASAQGIMIADKECKEQGRFFICDIESGNCQLNCVIKDLIL